MRRSKRIKISNSGREEAARLEYFAATHLHHVGNDDWYGTPFFLEDFQRDNIWNPILGTGRMRGGMFRRRYRTALVGLPRDYGKTELACALLLSEANMHPVHNGQYGIVAYSKEQSGKILRTMKAMIALDPDLRGIWIPLKHEIENVETGAIIKVFPYSEAALQSWHFNLLIADELHVWRDDTVWNAIISGMGSIPNSLVVAITTASGSRSGFLWDWLEGTDDLISVFDDDEAYCWWLGADDADDADDPKVLKKLALPSWIKVADLLSLKKRLRRKDYERYVLNRFPTTSSSFSCFTSIQLASCCKGDNDFDFDSPYTIGIDGATSGDCFAIVAYQRAVDPESGAEFGRTCEWVFDEPDQSTGHYPVGQIAELIATICADHYPEVVGIDPNRMIVLSNLLSDSYGVVTTSFAQNNATMCQASGLVMNLVKSRKLRLRGCGKLRDHLANAVEDDKGSYGTRFGKNDRKDKIDAAIALAIAVLAYDKLVGDGGMYGTFNS